LQSPEQIEKNFGYLQGLVTYMKSCPEVRFITASEALDVMPDRAQGRTFSDTELAEIAAHVTPEASFQVRNEYALTASEIFDLLNRFVARSIPPGGAGQQAAAGEQTSGSIRLDGTPYGPDTIGAALFTPVDVPWSQFSRTVLDVEGFVHKTGQIPSVVWLGSTVVPPESYLVALAGVARNLLAKQAPSGIVSIPPSHLAAGKYVADDSPALWQWPIFPGGFDAPRMMALARAQAWTLKPAILRTGDAGVEGPRNRQQADRSAR
jgi:hypothetical protein